MEKYMKKEAGFSTLKYKLSKQQKTILECIRTLQTFDPYDKKGLTNTLVEVAKLKGFYLFHKHFSKVKIVGIDIISPKITRSDSASFSRSIKRLEERGLIKTRRLSRWEKRYIPIKPYRALTNFTEEGYKIVKRGFSEYI